MKFGNTWSLWKYWSGDGWQLMALMLCVYGEPSEDGQTRVYHSPEECMAYILTGSYSTYSRGKADKGKPTREGRQLSFY